MKRQFVFVGQSPAALLLFQRIFDSSRAPVVLEIFSNQLLQPFLSVTGFRNSATKPAASIEIMLIAQVRSSQAKTPLWRDVRVKRVSPRLWPLEPLTEVDV